MLEDILSDPEKFTFLSILIASLLAAAVAVTVAVLAASRHESNREQTLEVEARKLGLSCHIGRRRSESMDIPPLRLLRGGTRRFVDVILEGTFQGRDLRIMEFSFDHGGGKHDVGVTQTVALFRLSSWTPSLHDDPMDDDEDWESEDDEEEDDEPVDWSEEGTASFRLEPRRWNTRRPGRFEVDVVFERDRSFSRSYVLRGSTEEWVRATFPSSVRSFFRSRPGWTVECDHFELVACRKGKRIRATDLREFCKETVQICNQFEETSDA